MKTLNLFGRITEEKVKLINQLIAKHKFYNLSIFLPNKRNQANNLHSLR